MRKLLEYARNNKLGVATIALALVYMFLGMPAQIWRIWQTRNVTGISVLMFSLLTAQSISWILYGRQKKDWFIVASNVFGALFAGVIVLEWFWLH